MNKTLTLTASVAAVSVAFALYFAASPSANPAPVLAPTALAASKTQPAAVRKELEPASENDAGAPRVEDFRGYTDARGTTPLAAWPSAIHEADARWLSAHGFPTAAQFRHYNEQTPQWLQRAAESGDVMALTFLGRAKLHNNQIHEGRDHLAEAASRGALYALHSLAEFTVRTAQEAHNEGAKALLYQIACEDLLTAAVLGDTSAISKCEMLDADIRRWTQGRSRGMSMLSSALGRAYQLRQRRIAMGLGDFPPAVPRGLLGARSG